MMRARVAALVAALVLAAPGPAVLTAQVSPGPLAKAHQSLEGARNCTTCHGGRNVPMNNLCLDCHREIGWLIARGRGYHATDPAAECASCHPDHAGPDFRMIQWPDGSQDRFDHRRTGWALEDSHGEVKCADCHDRKFRGGEAARLSPRRGAAAGWVGLERDCVSCHEDVHRKALDQRCEVCHDVKRWDLASRYDHVRSRYPLTGAHDQVSCEACHKPPRTGAVLNAAGKPIPIFRPLRFAQCSDCHQDPHAGRLGASCDDCHVTRGFRVIGRDQFNHERTRYPLRGKHASVACADCHAPGPAQWKPAFATCSACHKDAHAGRSTLAGKPADCAACHTVNGFAPGTLTVAQHAITRYPLEGKHQSVTCAQCHVRPPGAAGDSLGSSRVQLRPGFATCRSCHPGDHAGQLATRPDRDACEGCHTVKGWRPSSFTATRHAELKLKLEGRHAEIACAACHGASRPGLKPLPSTANLGRAQVALVLPELECQACHVDPHRGSIAGTATAGQCGTCHDLTRFRPSTVDVAGHQRFGFKLEGAHRAVSCEACHTRLKQPALRTTLVASARTVPEIGFAVANASCEGCHQSPHGNQFADRNGGRCETCHDQAGFRPAARFEHRRDTAFPLEGAHQRVPCASCHPAGRGPDGRSVIRYKPTPTRCESCHLEVPRVRSNG
jgi:hypothetical protein